jgi:16S rRNA (cytidine1402-2'-O)-methyltransferase
MRNGTLYLIPSFLAETNDGRNFPSVNLDVIRSLEAFIVENVRTARRFLRKVGYQRDFDQVVFFELNKHTDPTQLPGFLGPLGAGQDLGLLSEAGIPCIADPGGLIVSLAHEAGIRVVPLSGPSSIFLALMASGFNGQHFVFHGYLPIGKKDREQKLRELEKEAHALKRTQIFMETPYRNNALLDTILQVFRESTLLCVATMITHEQLESIKTRTVGSWRRNKPDLHKQPTVFLVY